MLSVETVVGSYVYTATAKNSELESGRRTARDSGGTRARPDERVRPTRGSSQGHGSPASDVLTSVQLHLHCF